MTRAKTIRVHVEPFAGSNIEPEALEITGIDPHHPLRPALPEKDVLMRVFREVRRAVRDYGVQAVHPEFRDRSFDVQLHNLLEKKKVLFRELLMPAVVRDSDYDDLFNTTVGA